MSISEAPDETANLISSNRAVSGVCPAGKPVATTIQHRPNPKKKSNIHTLKCDYYIQRIS